MSNHPLTLKAIPITHLFIILLLYTINFQIYFHPKIISTKFEKNSFKLNQLIISNKLQNLKESIHI